MPLGSGMFPAVAIVVWWSISTFRSCTLQPVLCQLCSSPQCVAQPMLPVASPGSASGSGSCSDGSQGGLLRRAPFYLSAGAAAAAAAVTAFALPETACGRAMAETKLSLQRQKRYRRHGTADWQGAEERPEGRKDSGSKLLPLLRRDTTDCSAAVPSSDGSSSSSCPADSSRQHVADMIAATAAPSASAQHPAAGPAAHPAQGWGAADGGAAGDGPRWGQAQRWLPRVPAGWLAILSSIDFCAIALVGPCCEQIHSHKQMLYVHNMLWRVHIAASACRMWDCVHADAAVSLVPVLAAIRLR